MVQTTNLPIISWWVLVIMKSAWFMAMRSAVNWHEKWYFSSNCFQKMSDSGYLVFSKACAMLHCKPEDKAKPGEPESMRNNWRKQWETSLFLFFYLLHLKVKMLRKDRRSEIRKFHLSYSELMCQQRCHQVPITVVSDDQIRDTAQLTLKLHCNVLCHARSVKLIYQV